MEQFHKLVRLCLWTGVTCGHRHQRVTELDLSNQRIGGILSPYVGNLSFLRYINLSDNSFHGEIPQEIGNLLRLEKLALPNNSFSGTIPTNLSRCSNLIQLRVSKNKLEGQIPEEIGSLLNLQTLAIDFNYLTGQLPDFVGNLSALGMLLIRWNSLGGQIPTTLGLLRNLVYLNVAENQFSGINNFVGSIPDSLSNASNLERLDLSGNQFKGKVSIDFSSLKNLWWLNLEQNNLGMGTASSIPDSLSNASNLERLDLSGNQFKGKVSIDFSSLKNLWWLNLEQNNLGMGTANDLDFVTLLTNCSSLKALSLCDNQFGGELPHSIANLSSTMIQFRIGGNQISGTIPSGIRNLVNLIALTIEVNQLHGIIPDGVGELQHLQQLYMFRNFLQGSIPPSLGNLTKLADLALSFNNLQGNIPSSLGNCQNLKGFDASHNKLTGAIPQQVLSITTLSVYLALAHNLLNDSLPLQVGNLKNLVNVKLCGGIDELHLLSCPSKGSRKPKLTLLKVLIPVVVSCLILSSCLTIVFARRRRSAHKSVDTSPAKKQFPMISYAELSKATSEFASSNMIGQGSFGSVYKGILGGEEMIVAVKVINLKQKGAFRSFVAECEALRNIRHRNLIKIITICSSIDSKGADFKALVFEYMENGSLEDWLHQSNDHLEVCKLTLIQRVNIAIDVASAIEYLHHHCQPPIVHGDLKPSNVLLDHDMVAHVGDFGLAKFLSRHQLDSASKTPSSSIGIKGTVGYVAPEYGMGSEASMTGDVYSFGILLLEMFTGRRPTDAAFTEGLTLHEFVKMTLPEKVIEIVDPSLLMEVMANNSMIQEDRRARTQDCLNAITRTGVLCSMESPFERMEMRDVVAKLCHTRETFLGRRV
ncbi:putative receptor-like protein kinase [Citrus sinensis]|nr:putative receptor-like protein kinase [Citrus sinensis]